LVGSAIIKGKQSQLVLSGVFLGIFISVSMVPPADSVGCALMQRTIPLSGYIICCWYSLASLTAEKGNIYQILTPAGEGTSTICIKRFILTSMSLFTRIYQMDSYTNHL